MTTRQTKAEKEEAEARQAALDAAAAEQTSDAPKQADADAEEQVKLSQAQAAAVVAAHPEPVEPVDLSADPGVDVSQPKKAGNVEVKVLHDCFNYIDESGFYQTVLKGQKAKVTAAQADRAEELGAVERV